MYYWVVDYIQAKDGSPKPVVMGGRAFSSEVRAQKYIDDSNLSRKAEIFELPTSSQARATSMVKARLIRRYRSLRKGMTRAVHK